MARRRARKFRKLLGRREPALAPAPERRPGRAREHPAGGARRTEAERTTASTHGLPLARGAPGALRLLGTGRGVGRRAARGARRPVDGAARYYKRRGAAGRRAQEWGARAAKLAASHPLDEAERRRRLEQCAISLERVVAAPPCRHGLSTLRRGRRRRTRLSSQSEAATTRGRRRGSRAPPANYWEAR